MIPGDKVYTAALNCSEAVLAGLNLPSRVYVDDCTLRDGEQAVGLTLDEKIEVALMLDRIGVSVIQAGAPGRSADDQRIIAELESRGVQAQLEVLSIGYTAGWRGHLDACIASGAGTIEIVHPTSDVYTKSVLGISRAQVLENSVANVRYAREHSDAEVVFGAMDAVRTDLDYLAEVFAATAEAGADRLYICDTNGVATPRAIWYVVSRIRQGSDLPMGVHCHNDFGLALANSLAAVEAGAQYVDVTINGIGERSGNLALDELVMAVEALYGIETGVDTTRLTELARMLERITKVPVSFTKPLVGPNAFCHRHDIEARAVMISPASVEAINPAVVGNKREIGLGKYSGPYVVSIKAYELGVELPQEHIESIVARVRAEAVARKRSLTDEEFLTIVAHA